MKFEKDDEKSSGIAMPNSEVHNCIIITNHGTLVFDENFAKKYNLTFENNVLKIREVRQEAPAGNNMENTPLDNNHERNEERFHFVHPEIEDDEAWRIHHAVKRLVVYQKIPEICAYFKELRLKDKVLLPANASTMYGELRRMGMPSGEGFSEKHFFNSYMRK